MLPGELSQFGLNCSRAVATRHIERKIAGVAEGMDISRRNALACLTDDVVRETAVEFANEAPGGDPSEMPPTYTLPISLTGRTIAALSIAAGLVLTDNPARGGDPVADTRQVLDLVFMWGIMIQDSEADDIPALANSIEANIHALQDKL